MWKLTLPDGTVLIFDDWESARIEGVSEGYRSGTVLVPERVPADDEPREQ